MTKILIVDDNSLFTEGLKRILQHEAGLRVSTYTSERIKSIYDKDHFIGLSKERPELLILDTNLDRYPSYALVQNIKKNVPTCRILLLANVVDEEVVSRFFKAGVDGYLLKTIKIEMLIDGIQSILNNKCFVHPSVAHFIIEDYRKLLRVPKIEKPLKTHNLSRREFEVLELLAAGKSNRAISEQLYLSEKTVKNHVSRILEKLKVEDRTNAVLYAIKHDLVCI